MTKTALRYIVLVLVVILPLDWLVLQHLGNELRWWAVAYAAVTTMVSWWAVQPRTKRNERTAIGDRYYDGPSWRWFGLSRAAYLVVPHTVLCAMPRAWQQRFFHLVSHLPPSLPEYHVQRLDDNGKYVADPLLHYRHPDSIWPHKSDIHTELEHIHKHYSRNEEHLL